MQKITNLTRDQDKVAMYGWNGSGMWMVMMAGNVTGITLGNAFFTKQEEYHLEMSNGMEVIRNGQKPHWHVTMGRKKKEYQEIIEKHLFLFSDILRFQGKDFNRTECQSITCTI